LSPNVKREVRRRRSTSILLGLVLLPWAMPSAAATTTPGMTAELVGPEQGINEASSAVPVFGFGMTADTPESLYSINISFSGTGFSAGDPGDLAPLDADSAVSGVGLYRDTGSTDDVLDSGDIPVQLTDLGWAGAVVQLDLTGGNEPLPSAQNGNYTWFIVVRTSNDPTYLGDGNRIQARIVADNILATDGAALASQPASDVAADALIVRLTRGLNLVSNGWIGPSGVLIDEMAPLGLRIVDGGAAGVSDSLTSIQLELWTDSGVITSSDFAPITTNAQTSGIAFYRDDGTSDDAWDASDGPVNLASISPTSFGSTSPQVFTMDFSPALPLPDDATGTFDFMVVVRTGTITTGDYLYLHFVHGSAMVDGLLASDQGRALLFPAWSAYTNDLMGDDTPPSITSSSWTESSQYLAVWDGTLYFNQQMPAAQTATARGQASDFFGSGLRNATWSNESSLESSPPPTGLSGGTFGSVTFQAPYRVAASSTDSASPADFTVFDWVGNSATASASGHELPYMHREDQILIDSSAGWSSADPELYIAPDGTLYFSDHIYSGSDAQFSGTVVSLYGGGLKNVSVSPFATADGPSNPFDTFAPGVTSATFTSTYTFHANSTQGTGSIRLSVTDQSGNSLTQDFQVREDNTPPAVTFLQPSGAGPLSGNVRVVVSVADAGAGVRWVFGQVDPMNGTWTFYSDGANWFYDVPTAGFTDGPHSILVTAVDWVGNMVVVPLIVQVTNGVSDTVAPRVALVSPPEGALASGQVTVQVSASDLGGVSGVWVRDGQGAWQLATFNGSSGMFEFSWDTTGAADGPHVLTAMARDNFGNEAETGGVTVTVDNAPPQVSLLGPAASQQVAGTYTITVFAADGAGLSSVTASLDGQTVVLVLNPSTGNFEYTFDTRTLKDGKHTVGVTALDAAGHNTQTGSLEFTVQNGDAWRAIREATNFLVLLFLIAASVALLMLARRGTLAKWVRGEASVAAAPPKDEEKEKPKAP